MEPTEKQQVQIPSYLKLSKIVIWFLYFYILLGIISLVLRVFLLLFNANQDVGFSEMVANISGDYLEPFRGIFPTQELHSGGYLDVSSLFAILVYLIILWGIHAGINYVQNKIDISRATQEKELAEIKRQKELAAMKAQKVVVERTIRTTNNPPRKQAN